MQATRLARRAFLQSLMASAAFLNSACWANGATSAVKPRGKISRLVLIELAGGNDGLNTVVPYTQQQYYAARPVLGIARDKLLKLDEHLGLAPELEPLLGAWQSEDLHIALGVGYPEPNRSHFRSIDIWNTASGSDKVLEQGWLSNAFSATDFAAEGIVFGGDFGPLLGSGKSLVLEKPEQFAKQARQMKNVSVHSDNVALTHVVAVRQQIAAALDELQGVLASRDGGEKITGSEFAKQLHLVGDLIEHDVNVPVLKATLKGFDTHFYQPNRHKGLMTDLAVSLAAFRQRLITSGNWHNTLVMTYSEFGRRPAENGSRGTDHGTSAPVLILGGKVKGGLSGKQPRFPDNREQDMAYHLDYRSIYRTVAQKALGIRPQAVDLSAFELLNFI